VTPITIRSNQSSGKRKARRIGERIVGDDRGAGKRSKAICAGEFREEPWRPKRVYVGVYGFGDGERNRCRTAPLLFYRYLLKLSPNGSEGTSTDHE
jgi:hypothetical protein